jgi:2-polyprenyl-6-methoxyphenol hydroxylase-like FAD-dependent oxidoreductase
MIWKVIGASEHGLSMEPKLDHAIVLGGSLAGLLAARVLCDHAERVTIVERDAIGPAEVHRKGTPQSHHANNVTAAGVAILERLFPDLGAQVVAAGATRTPLGGGVCVVLDGHRHAHTTPTESHHAYALGRPLLEALIRRAVLARSNVTVVEGAAAGLIGDDTRVRGAIVEGTELHGDLVVDALGRGSAGPRWVSRWMPLPVEEVVEVEMRYTSRVFPRSDGDADGARVVLVTPTPGIPRGGIAMAIEGDHWMVTLFAFGVPPPTELGAFRAFAASLVVDDIASLVDRKPVADAATHRFPAARWRRFDKLRSIVDGYLPLGDVVCTLNPSYGMGTTSAAFQTRAFEEALASGTHALARRTHRAARRWIARPWQLGRSSDLRFPGVVGGIDRTPAAMRWYLKRAGLAATRDPIVAFAFRKVMALVAPPTSLMLPPIAMRVLARGRA